MQNNSVEINTYDGYIFQINCNKAERGLKTIPWSHHCLDVLALDMPFEYARMALKGEFQDWFNIIILEYKNNRYCSFLLMQYLLLWISYMLSWQIWLSTVFIPT